jgi:hypothetical protein
MSTKTEIIYTYKSPVVIPPGNIHGLQDGLNLTSKLSIGILDTQDYDYIYITGFQDHINNNFYL